MCLRAFLLLSAAAAAIGADAGRVVVANRASSNLTVIDVKSDRARTVPMPSSERPAEPMYVVYSPVGHHVFVGDRANNVVVVFDASDLTVKKAIPVGVGVWHMWISHPWRQLWVVGDVDRTITIIDTVTLEVTGTASVSRELVDLGARPHDVILDPYKPAAYVSLVGLSDGSDYVLKYSLTTFAEVGRQKVGKDPHLSLTWRNGLLYVPCQGSGQVFVLDRETLRPLPSIPVPGAHGAGMTRNGSRFFTTNFTANGVEGLFAIDTEANAVIGSTVAPYSTPHNIALTPNGKKIYVTHSGNNSHVSVYLMDKKDSAPSLVRTVMTGNNPFGLSYVP